MLLLPGFDEYLLGYKDRSLHGDERLLDRVVPGGNGVFRATIVADGAVAATWTRSLTTREVRIVVTPVQPLSRRLTTQAVEALETYADFLGRQARISFA